MAERGEEPEGILLSMTRNRFHAALWHSGGWKKAAMADFRGATMVERLKSASPGGVSTPKDCDRAGSIRGANKNPALDRDDASLEIPRRFSLRHILLLRRAGCRKCSGRS
jgi:hypothetical protein